MDKVDRILAQWRRERPDLDVTQMGVIGRIGHLRSHLSAAHERVFKNTICHWQVLMFWQPCVGPARPMRLARQNSLTGPW